MTAVRSGSDRRIGVARRPRRGTGVDQAILAALAIAAVLAVAAGCTPAEEDRLLDAWCERAEIWLYAVVGYDAETREPLGLERDAQDRYIAEAHARLWAEPAPEAVREAAPDRFEVGPPPAPDPTQAAADLLDPAITALITDECDLQVDDVSDPMA